MKSVATAIAPNWLRACLIVSYALHFALTADAKVILPSQCGDFSPRLEIRDLAQDKDQWNIFLLGLKHMQEANATDPTSYYALASIHSWPHQGSEGVPRCAGCADAFCPHTSHIFAIWHRPYVAAFEQALRQHAVSAAQTFANGATRRRHVAAAQNLRLPYWDWARPPAADDSVLPSLFTTQRVPVEMPSGTTEIDNPLYQFNFGEMPAPGGAGFSTVTHSTRHPINDDTYENSRDDLATASIQALHDPSNPNGESIQCALYRNIYQIRDYNAFAGSGFAPNRTITDAYMSLENLHDDIHAQVGGVPDYINNTVPGTFYYIEVSAFDPIFWMHHAMVDRMLTMWQVLNPDTWISPQNDGATWTTPYGSWTDGSTEMSPFFPSENSSMWTADALRSISTLCYYYDDVDPQTPSKDEVISSINKLYGQNCLVGPPAASAPPSPPSNATNDTRGVTPRTPRAPILPQRQNRQTLAGLSQSINNLMTNDGAMRDYIANIEVDVMSLGDTVTVYIFDGEPDADSSTWDTSSSLMGKRLLLWPGSKSNTMGGAPKTGSTSLNNALIARVHNGLLGGMGNNEVEYYLKRNMQWKVVKSDGCVLSNDQVPALQVKLVAAEIKPAMHSGELPERGNAQVLCDVTAGKCGGYAK